MSNCDPRRYLETNYYKINKIASEVRPRLVHKLRVISIRHKTSSKTQITNQTIKVLDKLHRILL